MSALATAAKRPAYSVGTATARMTRVLFVGTALTGIAFAALAAGVTSAQSAFLDPVWETLVVSALWGIPVLIIILAWWAPLLVLRILAVAFIAVYSGALVTWPFVQSVPYIPDGTQPWIIFVLPVTAFAGALVLPEIASWVFLVLTCLVAGGLRFVADGSRSLTLPLEDVLFNGMYLTVFVAIIIVTLRAGRARDAAAERTAADAVITAVSKAQDRERALVAALTHDDVIATLLAAARATDATAPLVRDAANRALHRLDELSTVEVEQHGETQIPELIASLRATVESLPIAVAFSAPDSAQGTLPTLAARALTEATAEALRNSLRHADSAGRTTARVVTVARLSDGVTVEIVDDGAGFDLSRVSIERFGIRLSINHRMAVIAGGSALVESTPGSGTRVTLSWRGES